MHLVMSKGLDKVNLDKVSTWRFVFEICSNDKARASYNFDVVATWPTNS